MNPITKEEFIARFEDRMLGIAMFGMFSEQEELSLGKRTERMKNAPRKVQQFLDDIYRFLNAQQTPRPESPVVPTVPNRMPTNGVPGTNGVAQARR